MGEETVTRDKAIDRAKILPPEKLATGYEYGLVMVEVSHQFSKNLDLHGQAWGRAMGAPET
jgi:hypothetical protein